MINNLEISTMRHVKVFWNYIQLIIQLCISYPFTDSSAKFCVPQVKTKEIFHAINLYNSWKQLLLPLPVCVFPPAWQYLVDFFQGWMCTELSLALT